MEVLILFFALGCITTFTLMLAVGSFMWKNLRYLLFRPPLYYPQFQAHATSRPGPKEPEKRHSFTRSLITYITVTLIIIRLVAHYFK